MHFTTDISLLCWTQPSGWVLLILWYKMIDVWLSMIGWSVRRHPNSQGILHHCKGILDRKMHNKCSVLKIRREQLTCWHVENEFWGQKHGYETDHLKNNLQLEVFDRESQPNGFIWLSWIHISFFPTAAGRIDFKPWVTDCVYIRREAQSWW